MSNANYFLKYNSIVSITIKLIGLLYINNINNIEIENKNNKIYSIFDFLVYVKHGIIYRDLTTFLNKFI